MYMDVSENSGTPKSSVLIGFSIINHPFWGTTIFGNTHIVGWKIGRFLVGEYHARSGGAYKNIGAPEGVTWSRLQAIAKIKFITHETWKQDACLALNFVKCRKEL